MVSVEYFVISIGALSHNRLWGEGGAIRTAHATTTLVRADKRTILVDPSLPAPALAARLDERTGKKLSDVTDVFCTTLRPVHRRSVQALSHANWWVGEEELRWYRDVLESLRESAVRLSPEDTANIENDLALLERFRPAPEKFDAQTHFYPLTGPSPGSAGLLLTPPITTIIIAGDAALTAEHVESAQVWEGCTDTGAAKQSLADLLELADVIVPGHDNVMFSPRRWI